MKAERGKELLLITENKVGKLAQIAHLVANHNIDIRAISAWAFDDQAFFRIVASDHEQAKQVLGSVGKVEEKDIVIVRMPDKVGQLFQMASKLKDYNIDLNYVYGTTSTPNKPAIIVFSSDSNSKAIEVISR